MKSRIEFITEFRGEPIGTINQESSFGESFQNLVLRPILKLQNDLFIEMCRNYFEKYKSDFFSMPVDKKMVLIENAIQKDVKFRNSLKGVVIGLFTLDEYKMYITDSSVLNKRMMNMIIERLKSQLQLLEVAV